ncbi:NAD(P)-dependent oxidoreductase [Altererythrobacter sp.]|nr:NAD(P)-dependent oxidoreductase [Altererythrobacter sp.]
MKISVLGLGAMGTGIARSLLKSGHTPVVWNRSPEAAEALGKEGATVAGSAAEAMAADLVFHVLYNDEAVRDVILDSDNLASIRPGTIVAGMSTISVALAEELSAAMAQRDAVYVATLMFGRPDAAASGNLDLVVSGAEAILAEIQPVLETLGTVWPMGDTPGAAHAAKLAGNYLIANSIAAIGESAAIASSTDSEPGAFLDMITQTLFSAPISKFHAQPIIEKKSPDDEAGLDIVLKDVLLALDQAAAARINLPVAEVITKRFEESKSAGHGQDSAYGMFKLSKNGG